jgi:4-amino-4-deoxy-L-arabinose transferase-like glycosyltransferase
MTPAARRTAFDRTTLAFMAVLLIAIAFRLWTLPLVRLNLGAEEAQLWAWSRSLDWGYAKPPLAVWAMWASTHAFGDAEWAVRLAAPLSQSVTALGLYALGRNIYGAGAGFWTGIAWLILPGVCYSSVIVSPAAPLVLLWTAAALALWRLAQTRAWAWAVAMGAAIGLGLLADYAMLYFPVCVFLAACWSQPVREALKGGRSTAAATLALAIFAPNLIWNGQHGFATVSRMLADIRLDPGDLFNVDKLVEFLIGQALVAGPIIFLALLALLWRAAGRGRALAMEDRFLLSLTLPQLGLVTLVSFVSHADASWLAAAYPAAIVWIIGNLFINSTGKRVIAAALALNVLASGVVFSAMLNPSAANPFKDIVAANAWDETAREIALRAAPRRGDRPFSAVLVDDRAAYYELNYYWRQARAAGAPLPPLRIWTAQDRPRAAAEAAEPLLPRDGAHVLVVHAQPRLISFVAGDFTNFRTVEHLTIPLGGGENRNLDISIGEGFVPAPRDAAFMQRLGGER